MAPNLQATKSHQKLIVLVDFCVLVIWWQKQTFQKGTVFGFYLSDFRCPLLDGNFLRFNPEGKSAFNTFDQFG